MEAILHYVNAHGLSAMVLWGIFSTFVDTMPEPTDSSSTLWKWLYRFLHVLAANLKTAFKARKQ
jgi:hypothetical protein